jgi:hypothetical protein
MTRRAPVLAGLTLLLVLAACGGEGSSGGDDGAWSIYTMSPATLSQAWADTPYSEQITVGGKLADAGQQPLYWMVSSGSLPPGMSLGYSNSTVNTLSGQPTAAGTYQFTLRVFSQTGTADASFPRELVVLPVGSLIVTTTSLPNAALGTPCTAWLDAAGGSGVGYTWSLASGSLPPGLVLDARQVPVNWGAFSITGQLDQSLGGGMLSEASGICASRRNPGILWVHDDSGAGAELYAVDTAGNIRQRYTLGFTPVDWEDIALGPGPDPTKEYLYIGDVGDNGLNRGNCRMVRVEEPIVPATGGAAIVLSYEEFWFTYPGGPQNCETLLLDWATGTPYLVEKTAGPARVHKFPMPLSTAWTAASPVTLLPVATGAGFAASTLTGGDASRDAMRVILRGYGGGAQYVRPAGGSFDDIFGTAGFAVSMPGGQQYEAVCYSADGTQLFTTTELASGANAPLHMAIAAPDNGLTTISGTPTASGTYSFIVRVRDSAGNTAQRALSITVP